jgi:hypothetical protein
MTDVCGANTKSKQPCQRPAGWGTNHVGEGRCKLHGGATPIKHGLRSRYSAIRRPRIKELLESFQEEENQEDLLPEVQLLRALILDYIERYDENTEALLGWHASFNPAFGNAVSEWHLTYEKWQEGYATWKAEWQAYRETVERVQHHYRGGWPEPPKMEVYPEPPPVPAPIAFQNKPREVSDILKVGSFIVSIGALIEKIQRSRQEGSITLNALREKLQEFGFELYHGLADTVDDESLRAAILENVEGRWSRIDLPRPAGRPK